MVVTAQEGSERQRARAVGRFLRHTQRPFSGCHSQRNRAIIPIMHTETANSQEMSKNHRQAPKRASIHRVAGAEKTDCSRGGGCMDMVSERLTRSFGTPAGLTETGTWHIFGHQNNARS